VPLFFDDAGAMARRPEVDLAVVAVRVPHHHALVSAVLRAGKPVCCEWPLGNGLAEAEEMAGLAEASGVKDFIGL
jgi:predicted dehydrogenase